MNNFVAYPSLYLLRTAVNYWLTDNITIATGYGKMWLAPTTIGWKNFAKEDRIYVQLQSINKVGKISVLQRLRNENRRQQKTTGYLYDKNNTFRLFFYYSPNQGK